MEIFLAKDMFKKDDVVKFGDTVYLVKDEIDPAAVLENQLGNIISAFDEYHHIWRFWSKSLFLATKAEKHNFLVKFHGNNVEDWACMSIPFATLPRIKR